MGSEAITAHGDEREARTVNSRRIIQTLALFSMACKPVHSGESNVLVNNPDIVPDAREPLLVKITTIHQGQKYDCSGALITPNIVLTAGHCVILYKNGNRLAPEPGSTVQYGANFRESVSFAGTTDGRDYFESPDADIALIRLSREVQPATSFLQLPTGCGYDYAGAVTVYGRRSNGQEGEADKYYSKTVTGMTVGRSPNGSRGIYLSAKQGKITSPGDSGGPWVQSGTIVGVTHAGDHYATRVCDHVGAIQAKVREWQDLRAAGCPSQTFRNQSDHSFVEFTLPEAGAGTSIDIRGGAYNKYVVPKCNRVHWSDLRFTCDDGAWALSSGHWDADGLCHGSYEPGPYIRVGDF